MGRATVLLTLVLALPSVAVAQNIHEPFTGPITAAKIRTAIDDAVMHLRNQQKPDGSFPYTSSSYREGTAALAALTMLAAGAHPETDDQLKRTLDYLAAHDTNNTYVRGIRANVWEYALRKVPYDTRIRELLKKDFEWLLAALGDREGWRYNMQSRDWDNSCTQYGVLGIWAAARAGFEPGDKFWITMSKHFRNCQNTDGGWGYIRSGSNANMATAGLASMFLVFDMYHARKYYQADKSEDFATGEAAEVLKSLERGMNWLGKAGGTTDGYYLYGIERTGVASGRKYIGGRDWFAEGAKAVLQGQRRDGSIPMGRWGGPICNTSFCTLFLVYGGAPVGMAKLEYGDGPDWNLNPRDLANLSKYLWSAYERPLNWETVSIDAKPEDFDAPILFITGSKAAKFTEEEMLRLREYIQRGGTILAEPSDHSVAFMESMEDLLEQMYPKRYYPDYKLEMLPEDHGLYTVLKQEWKKRPKLRGVSDGSRTFFLLSDEYLSADWQTNRTKTDAFPLAMNLLFYATDLGELKGKYATILPTTPAARDRQKSLSVARLRVDAKAHPRDWDAGAMAWSEFGPYAKHITGYGIDESDPIRLGKDELADVRLLHWTGRHAVELSDEQKSAMKKFVTGGGTLLVDAYGGSPAFAKSAKKQLTEMFGEMKPLADDHLLAEGRFDGGVDLSSGIRFKLAARQILRDRDETTRGQKMLVANVKKRPAIFFSEFDLSGAMAGINNYRCPGYKADSARKVVGNLVAWMTAE